ncbi:MAG: hypothetical protein ACREJP_04400 [Candidatus Methylomirabilales bacterium]
MRFWRLAPRAAAGWVLAIVVAITGLLVLRPVASYGYDDVKFTYDGGDNLRYEPPPSTTS